MNIEPRQTPRRETECRPPRAASPFRAIIRFSVFLLMLVLWWYVTIPQQPMTGSGGDPGPGSAQSGGAGSGDHGDGPGSGEQGDGSGSGEQGDGPGADRQGEGSGGGAKETAAAPDKTGSSANGNTHAGGAAPAAPELPEELSESKPQVVHTLSQEPEAAPRGGDKRASGRSGASGDSGYRGFYGVTVSARAKVLFLVDMSGSMSGPRMATLKQELKKALGLEQGGKRPSGGSFIIIGFDHQTIKFPAEGMARYRDSKSMQKAEEFIDCQLNARGGTAMTPAWQLALQEAKKNHIGVIYFLTDGEGELTTEGLLALLSQAGLPKLVVNCIAIGRDQVFMKEVAEKRKGKYVYCP